MLPALNSQPFRLAVFVPHFPGPTFPVVTLNFVAGSLPLELMVAVGGSEVVDALHPA
jgi:hypothetical protein